MKIFLLTNCLAFGNVIIGWIRDYSLEAAQKHSQVHATYNPVLEEWTEEQLANFQERNHVNWL